MENSIRGQFSAAQVQQLLKPIVPNRVLTAQGHSHVSQQDIQAHLIRMFGFGNFDIEVLNCDLLFEEPRVDAKTGAVTNRWDVSYKAMVRLTVRNEQGVTVAFYENGSTGDAQNQTRAGGHDLAYKSAISLSIKRAAISLGDQFGLSLYNKGQTTALVKATIIGVDDVPVDIQAGVEQQVSLGNDEIDKSEPVEAPVEKAAAVPAGFAEKITASVTESDLMSLWPEAVAGGFSDVVRADFTAQKEFIASMVAQEASGE